MYFVVQCFLFFFYALKIWILLANFPLTGYGLLPVIDPITKYSRKVSKLCF